MEGSRAGQAAEDDAAAPVDLAYKMWQVLRAADDTPHPMVRYAVELKAELQQAGACADADVRRHLSQKLEKMKEVEQKLATQIEVKRNAKSRLQVELQRMESTLSTLEEHKEWNRVQQKYTEACLSDVTSRESQLRLDVINATGPRPRVQPPAAVSGRAPAAPAAAAGVLDQEQTPNGHHAAAPRGPVVDGDEVRRIEAVLWHLGNKQVQDGSVRLSIQDFERYCASLVEQPWDPATHPSWVRCANSMLQHLQQTQTVPALQHLLLRCLSEIVKRWNSAIGEAVELRYPKTAVRSRVQLPEPSITEIFANRRTLEYFATKSLLSVNDDVKAEAAVLVTTVTTELHLKDLFAKVGGVHALVDILNKSCSEYVLEKVLTCLWHLAMSDVNKTVIREAGGLVSIVELLHTDNDVILENATIALGYLTRDDANKVAIRQCLGLEKLIATLYYPSDSIQSKAAGALWNCASNTENKVVIRQLGAIAALITLLHSRNESVQENAAGGLWNCAVDTENKRLVRELGGLQPLINLLSSPVESVVENASGTLWNCAAVSENRQAIRKLGGLEPLLKLLRSGNENIQENAAGAIRNCAIHDQNKVALRELGGVRIFVELLDKARYTVLEKLTSTLWICSVNNDNKTVIRECDGFSKLLRVLDHENISIREKVLGILRNCSTLNENRQALIQSGAVRKLTQTLNSKPEKLTNGMKEYAAATLWNVARDDKVTAREDGAIQVLVNLLSDSADSVVENAAGSLVSLTLSPENRDHVRDVGGIQALVKCLSNKSDFILEHVTGAIKNCVASCEPNQRLIKELDAIPRIVQLLKNPTENVVREAALALKNLAQDDACSNAIGTCGGVTLLINLAQHGQSESIRKVASFALSALGKNQHNRILIPPELLHYR